jgi:tetratricopeptide (TPR) repeat protein
MSSTPTHSAPPPWQPLLERAVAFHRQGDLASARRAYDEIIAIYPRHADALHLRGVVAAQTNDPARAAELIRRAVDIDPTNAAAHSNLGAALHGLKDLDGALAAFDRAVALQSGFAQALFLRGNVLHELRRLDAALASYDAAIAINRHFAEAYSNRGNVLYELERLDAALASYDAAIAIKPGFTDAHSNRGNVLRELDQLEAAVASYDRAIATNSASVLAYFNRGVALNQLKRPVAAIDDYDRAISLDPNFAEAHFNRSLSSLLVGDFARGWSEHEWRWKNRFGSNVHEQRHFRQPQWRGESLSGLYILLYGEQGFGDMLQFCRYVERVADLGARVILEVPQPLAALLTDLQGVSQLLVRGESLPPFDFHCPLMSLPWVFKTDLGTIPATTRYIYSDASKVSQWRKKLGDKRAPRVGLMWNGNPKQPNDRNRSFWLSDWIAHLPPGFQYVSLQRDLRQPDALTLRDHPEILDCAADLEDFSDTAALCECMDLVISVCTSVAHLSGGMGKRTWILLTHAADWRWLLDRTDSPWYPSATLYRQPSRGDWVSVFRRVHQELVREFQSASSD